jgi:hypothetical protein
MVKAHGHYYIVVGVNAEGEVGAAATLLVEHKFIHGCSRVSCVFCFVCFCSPVDKLAWSGERAPRSLCSRYGLLTALEWFVQHCTNRPFVVVFLRFSIK